MTGEYKHQRITAPNNRLEFVSLNYPELLSPCLTVLTLDVSKLSVQSKMIFLQHAGFLYEELSYCPYFSTADASSCLPFIIRAGWLLQSAS